MNDVSQAVSSEEDLNETVNSWNLKTSATNGKKLKKTSIKRNETSTPKRFCSMNNDNNDDVNNILLNLQQLFEYVKQVNMSILKLEKYQQQIRITLDHQDKFLNVICKNQKRIAKSLAKHKVNECPSKTILRYQFMLSFRFQLFLRT